MAQTDQTQAGSHRPAETGAGTPDSPTAPQNAAEPGAQARPADTAGRDETEFPAAGQNGERDGGHADEHRDETRDEHADKHADKHADADDLTALSAEELRDLLGAATAETAQLKERVLRATAEMENIRRRSQNEIIATRKYAIEGFARELLGVKDSLDQAAAVELDEGAGEAVRQMKEGLGLTLKQFDLALSRFAVAEVEAAPGLRFDPERHQAISMAPSADIEAGHIVSVVQKGFMLKERLLRPAMVVVAKPEPPAEQA